MSNMTFAQSVAEGRKQGGVSPQEARENYEKMNRQIRPVHTADSSSEDDYSRRNSDLCVYEKGG